MFGPLYSVDDQVALDAKLRSGLWTCADDVDEIFKNHSRKILGPKDMSSVYVPELDRHELNIDFAKIEETHGNARKETGVVYVGFVLRTAIHRSVYISTGSDDNLVLWLNGKKIFEYSDDAGRGIHLFDDCNKLDLHSGENIVLCQIKNRGGGWAFSARLDNDLRAVVKDCLHREKRFLKSAIVSDISDVTCHIRGGPADYVPALELTDVTQSPAGPSPSAVGTENWVGKAKGLFVASLVHDGERFSETLIVGDPADVATAVAGVRSSERTSVQLYKEAHQCRLDVLLREENRRRGDTNWERKVVQAMVAMRDASAFDAYPENFRPPRNIHFNGFVSKIDGSTQYYRLAVPSSDHDSRALIIILPVVFEVSRPFIESSQVSDHIWAEQLAEAANRRGAALLWSGYRVKPMGHPIDFAHFEEVLDAVRREYDFDPSRVSLLGVCSSGVTACMSAVRWPRRFAAIGLTNPFMTWFGYGREYLGLLSNSDFRRYVSAQNPMHQLPLSKTPTPMWIVQTRDDPQHGPRSQSDKFVELALSGRYPVRYDVEIDAYHEPIDIVWRDRLIPWLAAQRRLDFDAGIDGSTQKFSSLSSVVAEPFVVVVGTAGSAEDKKHMMALAESFQAAWRRENFVNCRITTDVALSKIDEEHTNLILLGNERLNLVWRRNVSARPIALTSESIKINDRVWVGRNLWLLARISSYESSKKVILIGSSEICEPFPDLSITSTGWFEFGIWNPSLIPINRGFVEAGFFGN